MSNVDRRRTKRVNPLLQGKLVRDIVLVPCLALTGLAMVVIYLAAQVAGEATRSEAALPSLVPLLYSVTGFVVCAALFIVLRARRTAFHVAGPVYRFSETMKRIRTGDVGFRIALRKGDVLGGLADEINETLAWLEAHPPEVPARADELGEPAVAAEPPSSSDAEDPNPELVN